MFWKRLLNRLILLLAEEAVTAATERVLNDEVSDVGGIIPPGPAVGGYDFQGFDSVGGAPPSFDTGIGPVAAYEPVEDDDQSEG